MPHTPMRLTAFISGRSMRSPLPAFKPLCSPGGRCYGPGPMKILMTGARGTVGRAVVEQGRRQGCEVVAWDRAAAPPEDPGAAQRMVEQTRPDALMHLAVPSQGTGRPDEGRLVNIEWTERLARLAARAGVPFVFTSTVMVFTDHARGPFTPASEPDARDGYGGEKREAEARARAANPNAVVARLGWQIGSTTGSNNMLDHLERQAREHGEIRASTRWLPACSFVEDTAAALLRLIRQPGDLYLLSSNERWNFFEIVSALNAHHGGRWRVTPTEDFVYDQRMLDPRPGLPSLAARLPGLATARPG